MNSRILFFSSLNIHAVPHMQLLNIMHFSYIITYSKVTTQLFLGNIVSRIIFQNVFNPKQHLCNMIIFQNVFNPKQHLCNMIIFQNPIKIYLPQQSNPNLPQPGIAFNQSSYQFHHQMPWNLETQVSSLLITRPTTNYTIKFVPINRK